VQRYDVCNGDADGLCAVVQWRLHDPSPATLTTGLKREIALLDRVQASAGDEVLVCDVSLQRNARSLQRLLDEGVRVRYFDHHVQGDVPQHPLLDAHLDMGAQVCTSVLMDRHLCGRHRAWAAVGAYGDNLAQVADRLCDELKLAAAQRARLRRLGEAINYNAYGDDPSDVHIAPAALYEILIEYADPLELLDRETIADELDTQRRDDLQRAADIVAHRQDERSSVLLLPDARWSRRVIGVLANELANAHPQRAHAVLKPSGSHEWLVSVRAPLAAPGGADALCQRFGGAGRAAAAGIDRLPARDLDRFIDEFTSARWG